MFTRFFFIVSLLCSTSYGFTAGSRLGLAHQGDMYVYDARSSIRIIGLTSIEPHKIRIRHVLATKDVLEREAFDSWSSWYEQGSPGSAEDALYIIDTRKFEVLGSGSSASWLSSLLNLQLTPLDPERRRKAGPPPASGEQDFRPIWNPKLIVEGISTPVTCAAFSTTWPDDGSDLANRELVVYCAEGHPFPLWVETADSSHHIRLIDSKRGSQ